MQDDPLHDEIMKAVDRVEVAPSEKTDVVYSHIVKTFPRRHRARRELDPRLSTLAGYLEQYPFMDNSRCMDYEGICALRATTVGAGAWLSESDLHERWLRVGATLYALLVLEELDVPSTWFQIFRSFPVEVRAIYVDIIFVAC